MNFKIQNLGKTYIVDFLPGFQIITNIGILRHMGIFNFQTAFSLISTTNFKYEFSDSKDEFKELGDYIAGFSGRVYIQLI